MVGVLESGLFDDRKVSIAQRLDELVFIGDARGIRYLPLHSIDQILFGLRVANGNRLCVLRVCARLAMVLFLMVLGLLVSSVRLMSMVVLVDVFFQRSRRLGRYVLITGRWLVLNYHARRCHILPVLVDVLVLGLILFLVLGPSALLFNVDVLSGGRVAVAARAVVDGCALFVVDVGQVC